MVQVLYFKNIVHEIHEKHEKRSKGKKIKRLLLLNSFVLFVDFVDMLLLLIFLVGTCNAFISEFGLQFPFIPHCNTAHLTMNPALPATEEDFSWTIRVYYEDTDAGGVVFYANYLKFFERARTEWLRAAGIEQSQLVETDGVMFVVKSTALDYHAPSRLDDELRLTVTVESVGRVAVEFVQQAWRLDGETPKLLATGRIKVVCVNAQAFRPQAIPQQVLDRIHPARPYRSTTANALLIAG